jgi:peptidylprolyl isomerase
MNPRRSAAVAAWFGLALAAGACTPADQETGDTIAVVTAPAAPGPTSLAPAITEPALPLTSRTECEDVPDAADYPIGARPRAFRPCSAPAALVVHMIRAGTGRPAEVGDTLIVDYTGVRSLTGELFDTSYVRNVPLDFVLGRGAVIAGWDQGLLGTRAGSLVKLDVPAQLAYGDAPPDATIQPGDPLTFVIEVRAVVAPVTTEDTPELELPTSRGAVALVVTEVTPGEGDPVEPGDTAVVHLLLVRGDNRTVLLSTWEQGDPLQVIIADGQSLQGIIDGLQGARVGATRVLTLPPDLAFGPDGEPTLGLPAGVDLIVVAEVVGVY